MIEIMGPFRGSRGWLVVFVWNHVDRELTYTVLN